MTFTIVSFALEYMASLFVCLFMLVIRMDEGFMVCLHC